MRAQVAEKLLKLISSFESFASGAVKALAPSGVEGCVVEQSEKPPRADQAERSGYAVRKQ